MKEIELERAAKLAKISEFAGVIVCVIGVLIALVVVSMWNEVLLVGLPGLAIGLAVFFPTLASGLGLVVSGRILTVVSDR